MDDADAVGRLLVHLYRVEAPGALAGPAERLAAVFAVLHLTDEGQRRDRWVAVDERGAVVGLAGLATAESPRSLPRPGAVLAAARRLGPADAARTAVGAVRGALTLAPRPAPDVAQVHTVVVAPEVEGRGLGARLLAALEDEARARGKAKVTLQVVEGNDRAEDLYRRHGYTVTGSVPAAGWRRRLAFPARVMEKAL